MPSVKPVAMRAMLVTRAPVPKEMAMSSPKQGKSGMIKLITICVYKPQRTCNHYQGQERGREYANAANIGAGEENVFTLKGS